ncbi:hypothetical protein Zmor_006915 [Zophobas morio]|uniref:Reverse transcriptase domain-containing protein n=1 Tax=Zophobas morio TaxID=2755281 RepID=A0AA38MP23_9CUCU|nr:hypothetical protein Zmor_006915 [Zophobas morio]
MYTNIASLLAKLDSMTRYIEDNKPDCILLTETRLSSDISDSLIGLNEYTLYRTDRTSRGGGACILLKQALFNQFSVICNSKRYGNTELVSVDCSHNSQNFSLVCVYRPPGSPLVDDELLYDEIKRLCHLRSNLIIFGDFNFPNISWQNVQSQTNDDSTAQFIDMLHETNLTQLVAAPTRFRVGQEPSLLDLVLTNDPNLLGEIRHCAPIGISDHCVIETTLQYHSSSLQKHHFRKHSKINFEGLNSDLTNTDWTSLYSTSCCTEAWNIFRNVLCDLVSRHTTTYKVKCNRTKPWITQTFIKRAKIKNKLWNKYRMSGAQEDYDLHRNFSNILKSDLRLAKSRFENNVVKSGPKAVYKFMRNTILSKVSVPIIYSNNLFAKNEQESANFLADFFGSVFTSEPKGNLPACPAPRTEASLPNINFTDEIVLKELDNLPDKSSPGPDGITSHVLRRCSSNLARPLSHIMERSFQTSKLPPVWLQAHITPVYKKGDKTMAENYRPISLTSTCCKVMERIIWRHLLRFLYDHDIITLNQHGFLPKRSTVTCLLQCLNEWTLSLEKNIPVDIIYLDFAKAFDRVPHRRLIHKLENSGIRGPLLQWIKAFLCGRNFKVKVGSAFSNKKDVLSGVPQGSVLGPVLFLVYISDLLTSLNSHHAFYADDGRIYGNSFSSSRIIQQDLHTMYTWTHVWLMPLNLQKCFVLRLGKNNPNIAYTLNNYVLESVQQINDLGVILDKKLSFSEHTVHIVKKANVRSYLLQKTFTNPDEVLLKTLFVSYIRPIVEYASVIWSPALVKDKQLIEKVQRRFSKYGQSLRNKSYEDRLSTLKLPTLEKLRLFNDLVCTYNILSNKFSFSLADIFVLSDISRLRGHSLKLYHENYKTKWRQNFLTNRVFQIWNGLAVEIVEATTTASFKNKLGIYLYQSS